MINIEDDEIPKSIKIGNFQYSFKQRLANNNFSCRCKSRKCRVLITIDADNLRKIINISSIG